MSVSLSKGTGRNRNRTSARHTDHFGSFLGLVCFQTGPLFCKDGHFYSAARIGQIRSGANKSPMNLCYEEASPYRCPGASTLSWSETRSSQSSVRSQRYSVIGAGCFWSALQLNQIG